MGELRFWGDEILTGLKTTLGTTVDGVTIVSKVEGDPLAYFAQASALKVPAVVIQVENFPRNDYEDAEISAKEVKQFYEGNIFWIDDLPGLATESIFKKARLRTQMLARRIANTQKLNVVNPLTDNYSHITYVKVGEVDMHSQVYQVLRENNQKKVVGRFAIEIQAITLQPGTGENVPGIP